VRNRRLSRGASDDTMGGGMKSDSGRFFLKAVQTRVALPMLVFVCLFLLHPARAGNATEDVTRTRGAAASDVRGAPQSAVKDTGDGGSGSPVVWDDPYPPAPAENDPAFEGTNWHPGPLVDGERLDYLVRAPVGDTSSMPLIVIGGGIDTNLNRHTELYDKALVLYIGPGSLTPSSGDAHNAWLLQKIRSIRGPRCSPTCPPWMFVPASAIRDVLEDFARHVRFAHNRVRMFGNNLARYDIYRALDPALQPYFSGVTHAIYAEWQHATCADAPLPTATPPRIYFSWGKCDQSFCPTIECMDTLKSKGYSIDPSSQGDTTLADCPCPEDGSRSHLLPSGRKVSEATYQWLLSNIRK
jgi:hypothetical protein